MWWIQQYRLDHVWIWFSRARMHAVPSKRLWSNLICLWEHMSVRTQYVSHTICFEHMSIHKHVAEQQRSHSYRASDIFSSHFHFSFAFHSASPSSMVLVRFERKTSESVFFLLFPEHLSTVHTLVLNTHQCTRAYRGIYLQAPGRICDVSKEIELINEKVWICVYTQFFFLWKLGLLLQSCLFVTKGKTTRWQLNYKWIWVPRKSEENRSVRFILLFELWLFSFFWCVAVSTIADVIQCDQFEWWEKCGGETERGRV